MFAEPQTHAAVPPERDGVALHRGTQDVYQPAYGEFGVVTSLQRFDRQQMRSAEAETLQSP